MKKIIRKLHKRQKIILGDTIRDKISGLTGIATSRSEFLNGCLQYSIGIKKENDTSPILDGDISVDEQTLEVLEKIKGEYGYEKEKEKSYTGGRNNIIKRNKLIKFR